MATFAGAVAAARAFYEANYPGGFPPTEYQNEARSDPWPPNPPAPWVRFEMKQTLSEIRGVGLPGSQTWLTVGHVLIHVFAPKGFTLPDHLAIAETAGEVFRSKTFYNSEAGTKVLCMAPTIRGLDPGMDQEADGNWVPLTVSIPFEFYFLK